MSSIFGACMSRKTWIISILVAAIGVLAGVMIAGRPTKADKRYFDIPPSVSASTTSIFSATSDVVDDAASSTSTSDSTISESTTSTPTTAPTPPTDLVPVTTQPRADIRVAVANGANRQGLASKVGKALTDAGWTSLQATNARRSSATSVVYFRAGFEAAAARVVADLGQALPVEALPAASVSANDAQSDVVVLLGANYPG